ncbi:HypC/HybG/HupF family hydrogenase formation chaperone [Lysinibacillus sphaericus]|uniref:Hydrogenase assembly protein HypC n=4 Tax=Lysinibacillus TaxID=400634 RepID=A0A2S0K2M1_LYSSH|nr:MULTISPECIES: HypC/HybG/HupF family hydrogenase formation chaperone [Lysinibacillus]AHN21356.1 hydrogenase assembly protein HypC [Lysinibacillus varians]AVK97524.1 hydrogenase assembly protein HypC [Lysinibacillus sphaericus]MCS1382458.1 HypC/HybG/HupF family hydrogenase formation chaperone [Lysinibacillus sphaericus]MED4545957.1 HypC/HybG/HupF family hydrogenase formation chaperone [Lysinibacillus sphaericus]TKI20217.1 HypC/HybG/HupF family hydrogenase formation chaperone [Lysinibacillus s
MCIGVPAKVIKIKAEKALVDVMGSKMFVGIVFVPEVQLNDFVLLHAGQAMTIVDEKFAKESMEEWRNIMNGTSDTFI